MLIKLKSRVKGMFAKLLFILNSMIFQKLLVIALVLDKSKNPLQCKILLSKTFSDYLKVKCTALATRLICILNGFEVMLLRHDQITYNKVPTYFQDSHSLYLKLTEMMLPAFITDLTCSKNVRSS